MMKRLPWVLTLCLFLPMAAASQTPSADPISTKLRDVLDRFSKNLVGAAETMPAEKYSFNPTPENMTFGKAIGHIAEVNNFACSKVADMPASQAAKPETDSKDKLVDALKASMDYCSQAFAKLNDSKLGESVSWFGGRQTTRFGAAIEVTNDLVDHYAALSIYLRMNGQLPPTAKKK